jgi:hypothetical protein
MDAPEIWTALAALAAAYIVSRGFGRSRWPLRAVPADRPAQPAEPARFTAAPPVERSDGSLSPAHLQDGSTEAEVTLSEERL